MSDTYKINLSPMDILQVIDGLTTRAESYEKTANILEEGYDDDILIEEISSADEAREVAKHFRNIIRSIEEQSKAQIELGRFTVVGFYTDNHQPWIELVEAKDPQEAAKNAVHSLAALNDMDPASISVIDVFEGKHSGVLNNETVLNGNDLMKSASAT